MGVRRYGICFNHNPSKDSVKAEMLAVTGLALEFLDYNANSMNITYSGRPNNIVDVDWISNENTDYLNISVYHPKFNYVEVSLIFVLKKLGGKMIKEYELPAWAGKRWIDIESTSCLSRFKAWWHKYLLP